MQTRTPLLRLLGVFVCVLVLGVDDARAELRLQSTDALKAAVKKPSPEYSSMAKQLKIQGDVEVDVQITESGEVDAVKVLSGNAILAQTVSRTVKDWKFTPFTSDGKPTRAVATLRFSFKP